MPEDETDQQRREREFAEYDASVVGRNEPTADQLTDLVKRVEAAVTYDYDSGGDGYNKSCDAMWKAALEAFNWTASLVGATGFQASMAALKVYGEAIHIDGPFMVIRAESALYPQYDLHTRLTEFLDEHRYWLRDQARAKLADYAPGDVPPHPRVEAHWRQLAEQPERATVELVTDLLSLVSEDPPADIATWDQSTLDEVKTWAAAVHLDASDNDVDVPPRPSVLGVRAEVARACRVCGCTDADCSQCVSRTGQPCSWVSDDLCSACA